jgi:preprotein translocase SecE subunit
MNLGMYKPGQGYWTRVLTAVGASGLAVGAAIWINSELLPKCVGDVSARGKGIVWAAVLGVTAIVLWLVLNAPRVVEFMIATESEMKKVDWPARKTLFVMTSVVIGSLFALAILVKVIDAAFTLLFQLIHIL